MKKFNKKSGIFFWITGLPGSGKTTIAKNIHNKITRLYGPTILLSGDDIRKSFNLKSYDYKERIKLSIRYSKFAKRITKQKINVIYAGVLFYFKELNDLPMSTTWVCVGLLWGRELAISTMNKDYKFKYVFPLIGKDFLKMIFGLSVSVGIVLAIHYIIIPNNWF